MKKVLVTLGLALATTAAVAAPTQTEQQPGEQPGQQTAQQQPGQQQEKVIKDPIEYNAYVTAVQDQDPARRAQALQQFLQQYPQSVMRADAMELIMGSYQQAGNMQMMAQAANQLLQANPNHVPALAVLAHNHRLAGQQNQNPEQNFAQARQYAQRGLQALQTWQRPDAPPAEFQQQRQQLNTLFNSIIGFSALQQKDYAAAQKHLEQAVQANPNSLEDIYPLALAYLEGKPGDPVRGLWMIARAVSLAPAQAQPQIEKYGRGRYRAYHGSEDGWQELVQQARQTATPPAGFTIKPAPTPAEIAAQALEEHGPGGLSFGDWQFILSSGNKQAADRVWAHMQGLGHMKLQGRVVESSPNRLLLSVAKDKQEAGEADVEIVMEEPMKTPPQRGAMIEAAGKADRFTTDPLLITMAEGILMSKPEAAAKPAARPPARKPAPKPR